MPIAGIEQRSIIPVNETVRLRAFDGAIAHAFGWYQDGETVRLVDGVEEPYSPETLRRMYDYLNAHGELYWIEALENGVWRPIGDVTFRQDDMPIVIGDRAYRGRGVGRAVVRALVERGKALGYDTLRVNEIYDFNTASQKCFESVGFRVYEKTERGHRYILSLDMAIQSLSEKYTVTVLGEKDIPAVLALCRSNPLYYEYCPPAPTAEGIRADMLALPDGAGPEDKFYVGFWDGGELVAALDLICGWPDERTAYIGLFMVDGARQGKGAGSALIEEILRALRGRFSIARLARVLGNPQSERFWRKNGFVPTGKTAHRETHDLVVMEKRL